MAESLSAPIWALNGNSSCNDYNSRRWCFWTDQSSTESKHHSQCGQRRIQSWRCISLVVNFCIQCQCNCQTISLLVWSQTPDRSASLRLINGLAVPTGSFRIGNLLEKQVNKWNGRGVGAHSSQKPVCLARHAGAKWHHWWSSPYLHLHCRRERRSWISRHQIGLRGLPEHRSCRRWKRAPRERSPNCGRHCYANELLIHLQSQGLWWNLDHQLLSHHD